MFYQSPQSGQDAGSERGVGSAPVATAEQEEPAPAPAHLIKDLPLWREDQAVLPYSQRILHVQTPGLVHMFEVVFSRGRPWSFGSLFMPSDSAPGGRQAGLRAGSRAPHVGVLMEVTRAIRLMDGGLFILVTATRRFQVRRCLAEVPFPRADVAMLADHEPLQLHQPAALDVACAAAAGSDEEGDADEAWSAARGDAGPPEDPRRLRIESSFPPCGSEDVGVEDIMMAAAEGAAAASAAESDIWAEYEFAISRQQQQQWDEMPREGADSTETHFLMTWVLEEGVRKVIPLPDGEVLGRWDLETLKARASVAAQLSLKEAVLEEIHDPGSTGARSSSSSSSSSSQAGQGRKADDAVPLLSREALGLNGEPEHDMALLEGLLWQHLDLVAALTLRLRKQRYSLPLGLLQLRPPPPPLLAARRDGSEIKAQPPHHLAASDGLDTFADRSWPLARRVDKLSWTVCSVFLEMGSKKQQAVLECTSVVARLWVALTLILEASRELTVEAAVQGLVDDDRS